MLRSLILLLLATSGAFANQRYFNYCQGGNRSVTVSGVTGTPKVQASYPQCQVHVYLTGTTTSATLFSDNSGTSKANPFTATTNGSFYFYAANGRYDVTISGGGLPAPYTFGDVLLADPGSGGTAAGLNSSDYNFAAQTPGGSLIIGNNTVTLTPCPAGVSGADTFHDLYISAGTGTAEAVRITGGTCTSGATTGTITFTALHTHSGAWTIKSATTGIEEAISALAASGGLISIPAGTSTLYATLQIGNGSGVTESTKQNIWLVGAGSGTEESVSPSSAATEILWAGGASTMVNLNGPLHSGSLTRVRLNGNSVATKYLQVYASSYYDLSFNKYVNPASAATAITVEAGAASNANSIHNDFQGSYIQATTSGSSCVKIGMTPTVFNSGNFQNDFSNLRCAYANDLVSSICIELGWADNNNFQGMECVSSSRPGLGAGLKNDRQAAPYDWLPSENNFVHTTLCGDPSCISFTGNAGFGNGNVFWPWQNFDSGGLPSGAGYLGARGWVPNGDFFDTAPISRMGFQNYLTIHSAAIASARFLGFTASTTAGSPTLSTVGTAVTGVGTLFLTQPGVGKMIVVQGNEFRYLAAVADNTHATLSSAFTDDQPLLTTYQYQTGANGFVFSDGSAINVGTQDASELRFWTQGSQRGEFDANGNFKARAGVYPTSAQNVQIRAGTADPQGSLVGNVGDLYMRKNGGTGATLYVKETGDGLNTGWVAK